MPAPEQRQAVGSAPSSASRIPGYRRRPLSTTIKTRRSPPRSPNLTGVCFAGPARAAIAGPIAPGHRFSGARRYANQPDPAYPAEAYPGHELPRPSPRSGMRARGSLLAAGRHFGNSTPLNKSATTSSGTRVTASCAGSRTFGSTCTEVPAESGTFLIDSAPSCVRRIVSATW